MSGFAQDLLNAVVSDIGSGNNVAAASTLGAFAAKTFDMLLKGRCKRAQDVMVAELKSGAAKIDESDLEDTAAVLYRYLRAAEEGAARLNLRLLAAVFAGQAREGLIVADDFLYFADMLASLREDEIRLLGTLLRTTAAHPDKPKGSGRADSSARLAATTAARSELVPRVFEDSETFDAVANSLQRTGLVLATPINQYSAGVATQYKPTRLLYRLNALAEIEGVLARSSEFDGAPARD